MAKCYCKYCGDYASSISSLTSTPCHRHPNGFCKGRHELYEGSEKSKYYCKFCGDYASSISGLTSTMCPKHPNGFSKGRHQPAL